VERMREQHWTWSSGRSKRIMRLQEISVTHELDVQ
jgi:hypothetical protein